MNEMNQNSIEDKTDNMYTYNDEQKSNNMQSNALNRNYLNKNQVNDQGPNPNDNEIEDILPDTETIYIDQSPPPYWMFFIVFMLIQAIILILIGFYYEWDDKNTTTKKINENTTNDLYDTVLSSDNETISQTVKEAYKETEYKYDHFKEVNIMLFAGFGFLRSFLKHHSWTSVTLTLISVVLSTEFGFFMLIGWSGILQTKWNYGSFNFQHLLDANLCSCAVLISLGSIIGKISMPQYIIFILTETIGVTFNYTLLRQSMKIIDIGGTLTVHLYGAIFGGVFSFLSFYSRSERDRIRKNRHYGRNYNSNIFSLFGTLILISYWPAFNTCLLKEDLEIIEEENNSRLIKYDGMINTYLAIIGSIIGTFMMSPLYNKGKFIFEDITNSCFSGGIVVGGCCHIIKHYWISILLGFFTGGLTTFLKNLLSDKFRFDGYHDTTNALYYHGIPGLIGGIFTTIFVGNMTRFVTDKSKNNVYQFIGTFLSYYDNYDYKGDIYFPNYAGVHFAAIFVTIGIALACGFLAGFAIKFCNCNIALRYFNDYEFFDVRDSDPLPWKNENIKVEIRYNPGTL